VPETVLRFGLPPATLAALVDVFARHPGIDEVRVYGSRAKGNYRPASDIDLTLIGNQLRFADLSAVEIEIEDLGLPYRVDLSLMAEIEHPALRDHIERIGQLLYRAKRIGGAA